MPFSRATKPLLADRINSALERHLVLFAVLLVTFLLACSVAIDLHKKMWIDELYTLYLSRLASPGEIVSATLEGCDGAPPLYAIIVHSIHPWVHDDALAVRLPSSLGFCGMAVCLLAFCRRRLPALYSFVAVLLVSDGCLYYATEGRCYGLVLFCAAGSLLCWQAAADGRRRTVSIPLLALCLVLMTALHYYSIFFLVPLFLAEMVRSRKSGKLDIAVLAALAPALLVLALHYPLIHASGKFQLHYWNPASWGNILNVFVYAETLVPLGFVGAFLISRRGRKASGKNLTLPEWVAVSALWLMPLFVLVLSIYVTHVFVLRYTLWADIGIAVLMAAILRELESDRNRVGAGALGFLLALLVFFDANSLLAKPVLLEGQTTLQALASLPQASEPVVIADHHVFMELSYYAPPALRDRLIYPVDQSLDLRYFGFDTGALIMSALSHRSNLHIASYDQVIAEHPRFVLAALPKDYLPAHLAKAGFSVVPINSSAPSLLYQVDAPQLKK
jgi:hypothetical protein